MIQTFPKENDYDSYIQQHCGGSTKVYTDLHNTVYYFDIMNSSSHNGNETLLTLTENAYVATKLWNDADSPFYDRIKASPRCLIDTESVRQELLSNSTSSEKLAQDGSISSDGVMTHCSVGSTDIKNKSTVATDEIEIDQFTLDKYISSRQLFPAQKIGLIDDFMWSWIKEG